jgi:hypothetical protein
LNTIKIPSSVSSIENQAFVYFNGTILVDAENPNYSSHDSILFNKDQTNLIQCTTSKTGRYNIPSTVKTIEDNAFSECGGLTNITIPASVTSFGEGVFSYCSGLTSVNIPPAITILTRNLFFWCKKLTSITIPSSVTTIRPYAFAGCDGLKDIYACPKVPVNLNGDYSVFESVNKITCILHVPYGTKALYSTASQWKDFANIIENDPPIANSGSDQIVKENYPVLLDGSNSLDNNHDRLTYIWTAPDGIILGSDTTQSPSFIAPEVQVDTDFKFQLKVDDGMNSKTDEVTIKVKQINKAPSACAGKDQRIKKNRTFILDGSASSDPDNDRLSYKWTAPEGITLSSDTQPKPSFTAPEVITDTNFNFTLTVNDGAFDSPEDHVIITVTPNHAPVANAGPDQSVNESSVFAILDGSGSFDTDDDHLTYKWSGPNGIQLSSDTIQKPEFIIPEVIRDTTLIVLLRVNDGIENSPEDQVAVKIKNVDKPPYIKKKLQNISVDKRAPAQTFDLNSVFGDYDPDDNLVFSVSSNTNNQVVITQVIESDLILSFSSQFSGTSEITLSAISNGKEISMKFIVEVKIPTELDQLTNNNEFEIYPNPTSGKVKIVFGSIPYSGSEILVTDVSGKVILKQAIHEKEEWIDLTGNIHGIYLIKSNLMNSKIQKVILK